jgi:DUF2950 family protein
VVAAAGAAAAADVVAVDAAADGDSEHEVNDAMTRTHTNPKRWSLILTVALAGLAAKPSATPPQQFATPDAAVDTLVQAVKSGDQKSLVAIFGSNSGDILSSGDQVADDNARAAFAEDLETKHSLEKSGDDKAVLVYGSDDFPFAIPLVKSGEKWHFDAAAGRSEILARRVGRNELSTIQVCLAYVDAQREYGGNDRDGDGLFEYAQTIVSTPGKHDGLYWKTEPNEPESPFGELAAEAQSEGYRGKPKGTPYHGYLFKVLKAQGPHAAGGAYDYVVRGNMIGGFALVAYPAQYGNSGIMTFVVNHDGVVYSKDLGPNTTKLAAAMTKYDPDSTWKKEDQTAQ